MRLERKSRTAASQKNADDDSIDASDGDEKNENDRDNQLCR
jgi:hypothetical protein